MGRLLSEFIAEEDGTLSFVCHTPASYTFAETRRVYVAMIQHLLAMLRQERQCPHYVPTPDQPSPEALAAALAAYVAGGERRGAAPWPTIA